MANKRISELSSRTPSATDLMLVGDPTTGYSYKCLVSQVGGVTSVFGRTGAVTAQEGDYSLTSLSDVTITGPASGDILTYNGSSWVNSAGGFVPYTGATQNVSLGEYGILAGWYRLDTTPTGTPTNQGTIYWDDSFNTAAIIMNGTTQEIGHDQFYQAKNSTGSTIPKGTAVRFAGTDGGSGHLLITPFLADGSNPSSYFMGVTAEAITNGSFGKVQSFGRLDGIDTSAFAEGDILYASTTVAGGFQTTVPVAPNNIVQVAAVVSDSNNGKLLIRPTLGSKLTSDESVKLTSVANGNVLQYNSTLSVWENVAPTSLAVSNIYTADGTLTANRTITLSTFSLTIAGTGSHRFHSNGNIGINTTTDAGFRLDVNGTMRVQGAATVTTLNTSMGTGGTLLEIIRSSVSGAPSIVQSISTVGGGTDTDNLIRFNLYNGSATTGLVNYRGDGIVHIERTNTPTFAPSAILNLVSTTKGVLLPRMTTTQRNAISSPATGLMVYDTTTNSLDVYNGTAWLDILASDFLTIDNTNNRLGINTASPTYDLHVTGTSRITGNTEFSTASGAYMIIGAAGDTSYRLSVDGDLRVYGNIRTAQPTGGTGVGVWRLGSTATGTFTLDTTTCVEIEIGGSLVKLATVS